MSPRARISIGLLLAGGITWVAACTCAASADSIPPMTRAQVPMLFGERAMGHVRTLVGFGPRFVGSKGWKQGVDYIGKSIESMGLTPVRDEWTNRKEGLTFVNISVTLPGRSPDRIVLGCHHDTKKTEGHLDDSRNFRFVGANDSGSGVGLMLELIAEIKNWKNRHATYEFVFLDGEESIPWEWGDGSRALFGSKHYVRNYVQGRDLRPEGTPKINAFVLLDMVGATDLQIDWETNSNATLRKIVAAAADLTGHGEYFFQNKLEVTDDHIPFLEEKIPAIDLIDLHDNEHWHTADDTLAHISASSLRVVGEVVLTALPAIALRFVPEER